MGQDRKPRKNPCTYEYLIFDKRGKNIQRDKDSFFNIWCWENCTAACKIMNAEHFLTPYTKINLKWIKNLNVRPETTKLLEENIGRTLDVNQSKILYDPPPRVTEIKTKINKWDLIEFKSFFHSRGNYKQGEKTTLRMGGNDSQWINWQRINFQNMQAAHTIQYQKKQTTQYKSGKKT